MSELPSITVAEEDYNRLSTLLERMAGKSDVADSLEDELSRADLVPLAGNARRRGHHEFAGAFCG